MIPIEKKNESEIYSQTESGRAMVIYVYVSEPEFEQF